MLEPFSDHGGVGPVGGAESVINIYVGQLPDGGTEGLDLKRTGVVKQLSVYKHLFTYLLGIGFHFVPILVDTLAFLFDMESQVLKENY